MVSQIEKVSEITAVRISGAALGLDTAFPLMH